MSPFPLFVLFCAAVLEASRGNDQNWKWIRKILELPFPASVLLWGNSNRRHFTNSPLSELTAYFLMRNVLLLNVGFQNCWSFKVEVFDPQRSASVAVMSLVPQSEGRCLQEGGSMLRGRFLGLYKNIINKRLVLL